MSKIVIVAPTYNEARNITSFTEQVLGQKSEGWELLICDSKSPDGTGKIVKELQKKYGGRLHLLEINKRGLGLGLFKGIDYAFNKLNADWVVTLEADLSNDLRELPGFANSTFGVDLLIGSRYCRGGMVVNWVWWRRLLSRGANVLLRVLSGVFTVHEFTNLYRGFNRRVWDRVKPTLAGQNDWLFVPAFIMVALGGGDISYREIPIRYCDRAEGTSKMRTLSYTRSVIAYALSRGLARHSSFLKFLVVGGWGFIVNTTALVVGVNLFGMVPANAGAAGAELAIISNFILNNLWTFSDRKLTSWKEIPAKFLQFNILSLGSVVIQYSSLKIGELIFGLARYKMPIIDLPYIKLISWYMVFYVSGVGIGLIWNYFMYSRVIWRKKQKNG